MSMQIEPLQQSRKRQTQRMNRIQQQDYFAEWREGVNTSIGELTKAAQASAVAQQAATSTMQALDARLQRVENQPANARNWLSMSGGCIGQAIYLLIASIDMVIALGALIAALWPRK